MQRFVCVEEHPDDSEITKRAAAGFLAAASAEIFGAGPVTTQLAAAPQAVFLISLLIVVGSCVPAVKVQPRLTQFQLRSM
jgi:hypothetical protein